MIDVSTRLRRAILHQDIPLVKRITTAYPHVIRNHDVTNKSLTSLHIAAELGNYEICKILIDAGHESSEVSQNVEADTPLISAASNARDSVVRLLVERFERCVDWQNKKGMTALMMAALSGHAGAVEILVEEGRANVEIVDMAGNSALHYATAYGHLKVIRYLIEHGAETERPNRQGWYPVNYSFTNQAEAYFKQLVDEREIANGRLPSAPALQNNTIRSRAATPVFGRSERTGPMRQRASSGS